MVADSLLAELNAAEMAGEARGEEIKAKKIAQNLIKMGLTGAQIVEATQLDFSTVESLMGSAHA